MARSKQSSSNAQKDGKYRKETKEERRLRLKQQEEAREACLKLLPMAGGVILVFLLAFGLYVRSVPPKVVPTTIDPTTLQQPQFQGAVPEFMNVDAEPRVKEALDEAADILNNLVAEGVAAGEKNEKETVETIEL
mmetsp:Transcript_134193/g.199662  ORF Transcript_134193/g.199662 Transcript_134193/m.199662 type:complete len:135 (-) Transcript_134193:94-498(-)|eukprot:CAMPEP_0117030358 /NCGR_PEP_ID=MMETSP0472-20121206/21916_1 /TAXON_ID=693140 ORGANISM="Tiarina fusus, Strain LIS" /NCGR_SAMPLE_ID=MMETSP0472 /ASSEMBLY_ACC=CAM_ASM_000603 /LENGTH=134 /DNA_ID=CAMNT_0004738403 /DNA_START=243 /DNA_END=647 /DNA_ORIENTATION=-